MISNIKAAIDQHFVISKLKKEAKILHREQPQFTLMECQNKVAQHYGYLHWHELHTSIKNKILKFQNVQYISLHEENNFYIGKEVLSNENLYLIKHFNEINIPNNQYSRDFLNNLSQQIISKDNSILIYMKDNNDNKNQDNNNLTQYCQSNDIPTYKLSFAPDSDNDVYFDFSKLSSVLILEMLFGLNHSEANSTMWTSRSISMAHPILQAFNYLNKIEKIQLTPKFILDSLNLDYIINMYNTEDFPHHIKSALKTYIHNLPYYEVNKEVQAETVYTMHHYLTMQITDMLNYLDSIYPYVLKKQEGKIEFSKLLQQQNKFMLIVDIHNSEKNYPNSNIDLYSFTTLFMNAFSCYHGNSTIEEVYKNEVQNRFRYNAYFILDNITPINGFNKHNPLRLSVNKIIIDHDGSDITPIKDNYIIIKDQISTELKS